MVLIAVRLPIVGSSKARAAAADNHSSASASCAILSAGRKMIEVWCNCCTTLGPLLGALGLKLVIVEDREMLGQIRHQLVRHNDKKLLRMLRKRPC
jgi:hypothetical protein